MSTWSLLIAISPVLAAVLMLGLVTVVAICRARRIDIPRLIEALAAALTPLMARGVQLPRDSGHSESDGSPSATSPQDGS